MKMPPVAFRSWSPFLTLGLVLVLAAGCAAPLGQPSANATAAPVGLQGDAPQQVQYLAMTDAVQPDPGDPGKQLLQITVHVHADQATSGVLGFLLVGDPGTAPKWPHPAYANGSPDQDAQQVKLAAGDGEITAKFPLRMRQDGKVQPNDYNLQSGGFYDIAIYGGGLPASPTAPPAASFQTNRQYALTDFGGPPATITPTPLPTPISTVTGSTTFAPTPTEGPTSTPAPTPTPLPPPFEVGLLNVQALPQLTGSVGAVPGVGGATITAPAGQVYVVAVFVVRRDLEAVNTNPLPTQLSAGSGGPWKPQNSTINAKTGSLIVNVPPYGPLTIVYDPRNQQLFQRQVAAMVWLAPTAAVSDLGALRFDGQPAAHYPMSSVGWVDPGFPYHLKEDITLSDAASLQVLSAAPTQIAPPTPGPGASPAPATAGLKVTMAVSGDRVLPIVLRLRLLLQDSDGLQSQADCPIQNYDKLVKGQPKQLTCDVPLPAGTKGKGYHLGVTGTINGIAIPTAWVDLGK